jgi:hypothetical protein
MFCSLLDALEYIHSLHARAWCLRYVAIRMTMREGTGHREIEVVHRACQQISPIYQDYATRPIQDGFSWSSSLAGCAFDRLYLIGFRSVRRPEADLHLLREHDDRAYEKALESGGLLRYFRVRPTSEASVCRSACGRRVRRPLRRLVGPPTNLRPKSRC